jgi:hypothetical protein
MTHLFYFSMFFYIGYFYGAMQVTSRFTEAYKLTLMNVVSHHGKGCFF